MVRRRWRAHSRPQQQSRCGACAGAGSQEQVCCAAMDCHARPVVACALQVEFPRQPRVAGRHAALHGRKHAQVRRRLGRLVAAAVLLPWCAAGAEHMPAVPEGVALPSRAGSHHPSPSWLAAGRQPDAPAHPLLSGLLSRCGCSLVSFAFTAQSLLSALGVVQFISNIAFGRWVNKEKARRTAGAARRWPGCGWRAACGSHPLPVVCLWCARRAARLGAAVEPPAVACRRAVACR